MLQPGDCSPSRKVVSKMWTLEVGIRQICVTAGNWANL
jgi:hypothetical protein